MSSKLPIVRQVARLSMLPQLAIMGFIMWVFSIMGVQQAVLLGALVYLMIFMILRFGISRAHRRGISLFKRRQYTEAIPEFERSYNFFKRHKWIDDFRFVTLFSLSHVSYREMALLNMAFCYSQSGNGLKAKEYYQRTLEEFPDSEMAKTSLRMIESAEKAAQPSVPDDV